MTKPTPVVVYLDFDGVLTTDRYVDAMGHCLNPYVVATLVDTVVAAGATVVVSSTWRTDSDCREKMAEAGFPLALLHDDWRTAPPAQDDVDFATGDVVKAVHLTRGQEVDDHARRNGVNRYVLVDDDLGMLDHQRAWHVATNAKKGFGPADNDRLAMLLALRNSSAL